MNLIPAAKKYISYEGSIVSAPFIQSAVAEWQPLLATFCACTEKIYGIPYTEGAGGIEITWDDSLERESYVIDIDESVQIFAADYQGCAYALATVLQLMNEKNEFEKARMEDKPDKDYRGLMVDLAREWHPFHNVLHFVDVCFFYKVKYLHLHFMDDESYTLPSKKFLKLPTEGRSYTLEEIQHLNEYAKSRGIVLIPEVEMPGHARAMIEAYPELFANSFDVEEGEVLFTESGARFERESVVCAGSEETFANITALIDETMELFPDAPYIHLGADEVNTTAWAQCSLCRAYMEEHHIENPQELYVDFLVRVTNYVLSKGKRPIVWEGFHKEYNHLLSKDVIVIGWECHYQMPDDLVNAGFEVINCAWKPLYIVPGRLTGRPGWNEADILKWNVYEWQHWWEKSEATLNPFHLTPTDQIIGAQLCSWELTYEGEIAEIVVRLAALSERTWSVKRCCTDVDFWKKLIKQMQRVFRLIAE